MAELRTKGRLMMNYGWPKAVGGWVHACVVRACMGSDGWVGGWVGGWTHHPVFVPSPRLLHTGCPLDIINHTHHPPSHPQPQHPPSPPQQRHRNTTTLDRLRRPPAPLLRRLDRHVLVRRPGHEVRPLRPRQPRRRRALHPRGAGALADGCVASCLFLSFVWGFVVGVGLALWLTGAWLRASSFVLSHVFRVGFCRRGRRALQSLQGDGHLVMLNHHQPPPHPPNRPPRRPDLRAAPRPAVRAGEPHHLPHRPAQGRQGDGAGAGEGEVMGFLGLGLGIESLER